jgi:hypothetical protein
LSLFLLCTASHTWVMAEIAAILAAGGLFVAGFVTWYTMWHRRMAAAFERILVGVDRSALVVRRGADLPGNNGCRAERLNGRTAERLSR